MTEDWSQWLDFDIPGVESAPESAGVFVMHASMKVLHIGAGQNIRKALTERMSDECSSKARRFKFMLTSSPDSEMERLLKEFAEKHEGRLPPCNSGKG